MLKTFIKKHSWPKKITWGVTEYLRTKKNKGCSTRNGIGGRAEMAEECEHLRRHSGDQPDQASDDDADFDIEESFENHNTRPYKRSATPYRTTVFEVLWHYGHYG